MKNKTIYYLFILKIIILLIFIILYLNYILKQKRKKVGVISLKNMQNIGNLLVKYAIFIKLKEYNLDPIIICPPNKKFVDIDFLKKNIKYKIIKKSFKELKQKDFDYLIVNSDQTWNTIQSEYLYDYGFLKFAENWTIPKFVYAASLGHHYWRYSKKFDEKAKRYLSNFTGISVREKGAVNLVKSHLGLNPLFVLDPTFLIDKKYYLNIIKDFDNDFNYNDKYLFIYQLDKNNLISQFINKASIKLNYKIFRLDLFKKKYIENFLFGINISEAVITDSFHGTAFSIIFRKPFVTFINSKRGKSRFYSLNETFNLKNRIFFPINERMPNVNILKTPLNINQTSLNSFRNFSINYLKRNLNLI